MFDLIVFCMFNVLCQLSVRFDRHLCGYCRNTQSHSKHTIPTQYPKKTNTKTTNTRIFTNNQLRRHGARDDRRQNRGRRLLAERRPGHCPAGARHSVQLQSNLSSKSTSRQTKSTAGKLRAHWTSRSGICTHYAPAIAGVPSDRLTGRGRPRGGRSGARSVSNGLRRSAPLGRRTTNCSGLRR